MPFFAVLIVACEMLSYLSIDMYLPGLVSIGEQLQVTDQMMQHTLTAWFLGASSSQLLVGPLSDRFGRRPLLMAGMLLLIFSSTICTFTSDMTLFLIARFIQGSTVCFIVVAGYASIHEHFEQKESVRILALMASVIILSPAFGPLLGSVLLNFTSWRWIFGLPTIIAVIVVFFMIKGIPETNPPEKREPFVIKKVLRDYLRIISNLQFLLPTLVFCLLFSAFIAWLIAGPFLVVNDLKLDDMHFSYAQILIFGGYIIGSRRVGTLLEKYTIPRLISRGLIIAVTGIVLSLLSGYFLPTALWPYVITLTLFSVGCSFGLAALQKLAINACEEPMGARMAMFSTLMSLSGGISSVLVTLTYAGTAVSLSLMMGALTLLASGIYGYLHRFSTDMLNTGE